jgi:hypothetical protein
MREWQMNVEEQCVPGEVPERLIYASAQIRDFQELIRFADTKAGAAVTLQSGLLVLVLANHISFLNLANSQIGATRLWFLAILFSLGILSLVTFLMVIYWAFQTLLPRFDKKDYKPSVAFFVDVFNMQGDHFVKTVTNMPLSDLLDHTLREVHMLSEIITVKFAAQRRCFQWLKFALVLWATSQIALMLMQYLV